MGGIHRWLLGVFCTARSDVPEREAREGGGGGGGGRGEEGGGGGGMESERIVCVMSSSKSLLLWQPYMSSPDWLHSKTDQTLKQTLRQPGTA